MSKTRHPELWRARLRRAVDRTGLKHSYIAHLAGVAPETLSRILTGQMKNPSFRSVVRIARATNESVGWILGENSYPFTAEERGVLMQAAEIIMVYGNWGLQPGEAARMFRILGKLPE